MLSSFLILLREALEAALVIGIVLGFLSKTNQASGGKFVWFGLAAGLVASLIAAGLFVWLVGEFEGTAEQIFEGTTMLAGGLMLFTLVIWLVDQKNSQAITQKMSGKEAGLLHAEVFLVVFFSVLREGVETVLFLGASSFDHPVNNLWGGLLGIAAAILLGYLLFSGALRFKLGTFFLVTNVLLILFGAGLISRGIGEFSEAGLVPPIIASVWNFNPAPLADGSLSIWHEDGTVGSLFKSLFGYSGSPSLSQVIGYLTFAGLSLFVLLRRKPAAKKPSA